MKTLFIVVGLIAMSLTLGLGAVCFLLPIISIRRMKDMYGNDVMEMVSYSFFLHKFVRLEGMKNNGLWSYIRFTNIISLFWVWGYALYLLGWVISGLKKICPKPIKEYFRYVLDLFK